MLDSESDAFYKSEDETTTLIPNGNNNTTTKRKRKSKPNGYYGGQPPQRKRFLSFGDSVQAITISWNHVNVFVPQKKKSVFSRNKVSSELTQMPKQILRDVSGIVKPGQILAILGASGAGKSTLLNVLTYRNRGDLLVDGEVLVNGQEIGKGMTSLSGYIQQDDLFIGTLKVKEHLWFQAMVRMDKDIPYEQRIERIQEVILELGLTKCANTMIGIPGRVKGISGGEMKRLAFASEVLTNPPLMFCDEPTSGLDSFMAENVIQTLKNMANGGKTIICTIHQPSSETFALFDRLMLMAEGRVAYLGPAKEALEFFNNQGAVCPQNFNPADHYVHTLAIMPGKEKQCKEKVFQMCDHFDASSLAKEVRRDVDNISQPTGEEGDSLVKKLQFENMSPYKASWLRQFRAVLWRCWVSNARDSAVTKVRFLQTTFIALIIGLIYLGQEYNQEGVQNITGALFLFLTNMTFSNVFAVINAFPQEMPIFRREHHNGMYRVDVYFLCKTIAELPTFIGLPIVFVTLAYWMVNMYPALDAFLICLGAVTLVTNVSTSFGYLISTASSNITVGLALAPPLIIPLMLFGGFFLNNESVPFYFIWLQYVSWFKYANEIIMVNQWSRVDCLDCGDFVCGLNSTVSPVSPAIPTVNPISLFNASDVPVSSAERCYKNGAEVLVTYSMSEDNYALDFSAMVVMIVVFRFLAFIFLWFRSRRG